VVFCCFNSLKELKGQTPRVGYCVQRVCLHSIPKRILPVQPNISLALNAIHSVPSAGNVLSEDVTLTFPTNVVQGSDRCSVSVFGKASHCVETDR